MLISHPPPNCPFMNFYRGWKANTNRFIDCISRRRGEGRDCVINRCRSRCSAWPLIDLWCGAAIGGCRILNGSFGGWGHSWGSRGQRTGALTGRSPVWWSSTALLTCLILNLSFRSCRCLETETCHSEIPGVIVEGLTPSQLLSNLLHYGWVLGCGWKRERKIKSMQLNF